MKTIGQRLTSRPPMRLSVPPKEADPHYRTAEHREWSKAVIQRAAGMCQDCGRTGARLFADHVTELRDGGAAFDPRNGVARCGSCHGRKTMRERARRMKSSA